MKLWKFFKKHTGKDLKARIYAEGKQVACFTLGKMHPELPELAECEILKQEGPDQHGYIDIYIDSRVLPVNESNSGRETKMKKSKSDGFFSFIYHLIVYGLVIFVAGMVLYPAYGIIISLIDGEPITWQTIKTGFIAALYHMALVEAVYLVLYLIAQTVSFWFFMDDVVWKMKQKRKKSKGEN